MAGPGLGGWGPAGRDPAGSPSAGPPDAVLVATGWEDAAFVTAALSERSVAPPRGVYLAPWLLKPDLLEAALRPDAVQVSVGASLAPTSAPASAYLAALRRFAPGAPPTGPGMAGYLETRLATASADERRQLDRWLSPAPASDTAVPAPGRRGARQVAPAPAARLELFTPVRLGFLPKEVGPGHTHDDGSPGWLPGATLASIGAARSEGA